MADHSSATATKLATSQRSLDPKLTRRKHVYIQDPSEEEDRVRTAIEVADEKVDDETGLDANTIASQQSQSSLSSLINKNPNAHLVHSGKWIKKEYNLGRPLICTGLWDCCGDLKQISVYCISSDARDRFPAKLEKLRKDTDLLNNANSEAFKDRTNRRRQELLQHIQKSQELKSFATAEMEGISEEEAGVDPGPTVNPSGDASFETTITLSKEEAALQAACSTDSTLNAPMLVAWLMRHYDEEPTAINGLRFLAKHLQTAQGCVMMQRHGVLAAVLKIQNHYSKIPNINPSVQKAAGDVIGRLLDCNFTRNNLIDPVDASDDGSSSKEPEDVVAAVFKIAHSHMNSREHVETALRALSQCCRAERCRVHIIARNYVPYVVQLCRRHVSSWSVCQSTLRVFSWLSTDAERMETVCRNKGVELSLSMLRRHSASRPVVGAAAAFLARTGSSRPSSLQIILAKAAVPDVIHAIQVVHDDEGVQRDLLKLLQVLSRTSEGFRQLDATRGGWQLATQGTPLGDALIHLLPGPLNNPGWCVGEQPHSTALEKQARQEKEALRLRSLVQAGPRSHWTTASLQEFMGMSMRGKKLEINNEQNTVFFELVSTLDLLPKTQMSTDSSFISGGIGHSNREGREDWFKRLKEYERENGMKLDEMVATIVDMRRRDNQQKQLQEIKSKQAAAAEKEDSDIVFEVAKPVFVQGVRMTSLSLAMSDGNAADHMSLISGGSKKQPNGDEEDEDDDDDDEKGVGEGG